MASRPNAHEFREVIGHFASGVTIVTTSHEGAVLGTTASAVASLSLDPPMVLVCMNRSSATGVAIAATYAFAINILTEEQGELAQLFATKAADRFRDVRLTAGASGQPLLDDALAHLECTVVEEVMGGTHTVFLAEVESARARQGAPLAYFRGRFWRLQDAPPAPR